MDREKDHALNEGDGGSRGREREGGGGGGGGGEGTRERGEGKIETSEIEGGGGGGVGRRAERKGTDTGSGGEEDSGERQSPTFSLSSPHPAPQSPSAHSTQHTVTTPLALAVTDQAGQNITDHHFQEKDADQPLDTVESRAESAPRPLHGVETGIVMPFEMDIQDSQDLLSLTEEMEKILDPKNTLRTPPPSVDLSPLECHTLQMEEVEMLSAIYGPDLQPLNDQGTCFLVNIQFLSDEISEEDVIKIWFSLPPNYPCVPLVFEIEANRSGSFNYHDADDLFDLLMTECINRVGGMMVFDLVTIAQDYLPDLIERKKKAALKRETEDRDRQRTMELEEAFERAGKTRGIPREMWDVLLEEEDPARRKPPPDGAASSSEIEEEYRKYDILKPAQFVGSISDILKKFPEGLEILRIENILREDIALRFKKCKVTMERELSNKERKFPYLFNLKPQIAFHGTLTKSLPSIVQKGLMIPGEGNNLRVRCGSSLGLGIYLSPAPDFSMSYTDSNRLIVCAALLGRVYNYNTTTRDHYHRYHAVVCGDEWVLFNAAQVLPCYVVVVQRRLQMQEHQPPPLSSLLDSSHQQKTEDETEKERKTKLIARARKFLPYGFGPGSRTVIEDAASFDDDEEDYGEYQLLRYADDDTMFSSGLVQETSELQEYRFRSAKDDV